jgi:thioredoxin-like negative regulator of GroEL
VVTVLNERFIPLKIDADREAALAQLLRIQSYPTLVLAAPDGKILGTQEGFLEAGALHERLQRTLLAVSNPDWMKHDYQEAVKAIAASDYPRALSLLRNLLGDGKDRPVQVQARQLLQNLEKQAATRLTEARRLADRGQTADATDALTDLMRVFGGTPAAGEAQKTLAELRAGQDVPTQQRVRRARELLAQAREDYRTQQYLCCLDRCEALTTNFGDLQEAKEARELAGEIENNPVWMQTACENLSDRLGNLLLSLAETWLKKGQPQQAVQCLERVVKTFPGSHQAEMAHTRLGQIQGQATTQANYKKD